MMTDEQLLALKARNPVGEVAGAWVRLRARPGGKFVGPCPICSDNAQSKTASRFECSDDAWVCAVCGDGGDVIKLMRKREGLDFVAAVERLGGVREERPTPAIAHRRGIRDFAAGVALDDPLNVPPAFDADVSLINAWRAGWLKAQRRAGYAEFARKRERERLWDFWCAARAHSVGDDAMHRRYLRQRGLLVPANAKLRSHPDMPLFADGRENEPRLLHRGWAMLAAIAGPDHRFAGLHITWIDLAQPKGKLVLVDPETGELVTAKKMRGSKAGGYVDLGGRPDASGGFRRMFAGEGIETTLTPYTALVRTGRLREGDAFRVGLDLGNLAGRAIETVPHPTLKTAGNRPQRVPGCDPDMGAPAMPVPDSIEELILLGDGDSDPLTTRNAIERAKRRHDRPGRRVRAEFAPAGKDFNDLVMGNGGNV